jgi:hypothetical protein
MADRQRAIRHAEAPASAEEQRMAAEADTPAVGIINRGFVIFLVDREI